jgi:hypothetical protein
MSTYHQLSWLWLPLCGGLTGVGLVLSYLVMRRRGVRSGLRGAAWSLLPLAAYLTGAVEMLWKIGVAIGDFASGFVLSTRVWSGIAVTGVAALLFIVSGGLRRRRVKGDRGKQGVTPAGGTPQSLPAATGGQLATRPAPTAPTAAQPVTPTPQPAKARKGKKADAGEDDEFGDVADILRRHGIT